ncbi:replicative DNA helicase [Lysobacter capsici]|uniref:replicative DNA helicase n=1 Tax=Lysobacter capsici TaxID=435897 RepID=UPI00287B8E8F|nr:DnaB-like helicase C-terminal domain-containing protein [Lysobacter capsici]WND79407.1 DnaB-like helicase C-terminal domain-containing protein [Lysobacter capsici]WND84603.1 DnaB-like helicase C-terminal domain-containing protein [Lysobacter capsici]
MKTDHTSILHTERAVLHTALNRESSLIDLPLQPQHFASEQHGEVWDTIARQARDAKPTNVIAVCDILDREGRKAVSALAMAIACSPDLFPLSTPRYYADLITSAWRSREAISIAAELRRASEHREPDAIDHATAALMALHAGDRECEHTAKGAMRAAWNQVNAAHEAGGALIGVPTGLSDLDETLGGLHDSDLIVIGARPAMGKTGLLLQMVRAASGKDRNDEFRPIGLISGEQPHEQVGLRWMAAGSGVGVGRLRAAKIEDEEWPKIAAAVADFDRPIRIYDRSSPEINDVVRIARRWKQQYGIQALYVDYLQRIEVKSDAPKHERVGEVARMLKNLARDLQIPVIALAQVSRKVEERQNQRPQMGDLADSSEIEKEADQIMTLWRDISDPHADYAPAEINVVKNRHGNIGTVHCTWHGASTTFACSDRPQKPQRADRWSAGRDAA